MKVYKITNGIIIENSDNIFFLEGEDWDTCINRDDLFAYLSLKMTSLIPIDKNTAPPSRSSIVQESIEPPIQKQEIWAAGVTYWRSREARMEEAKDSGGADFYAKVYDAVRPELFFKSTASRCVGHGAQVYIRRDSAWNVPEPELTLFAASSGKIVAYTVGNDMSSRDIEGENPLYLPQAKSYDKSAALGPCLLVLDKPIDPDTQIYMSIKRGEIQIFSGSISINQMRRKHDELIGFLFREMSFPNGVFLMTGTCLVPPNDFTLQVGDMVSITIDGIGTLTNEVAMKPLQ